MFPKDRIFELHNQDFFGGMWSQTWSFPFAISEWMKNHKEVKSVVELGTYQGGSTLFFALAMWKRGGEITSVDNGINSNGSFHQLLLDMGVELINEDIWKAEITEKLVSRMQRPAPCLLFCDNGNKPREAEFFWRKLKKGDYMMVHDWGTEFREGDLAKLEGYNFEMQDFMDELRTKIVCLKKM